MTKILRLLSCVLGAAGIVSVATNATALSVRDAAAAKIQHVIIIMQENRSFDHYFGTFPGANGIPANACLPISMKEPGCIAPFHDYSDVNAGGPHSHLDAIADFDGGKMDGFIPTQKSGYAKTGKNCQPLDAPNCVGTSDGVKIHDVAGYHDASEIPNYWNYAKTFMLQDAMFEPVFSYSLPAHLYLTSEWSAHCKSYDPTSCSSDVDTGGLGHFGVYPWTDLSYLLDNAQVSWKYYLGEGTEPDCEDDEMSCPPVPQSAGIESFWNPMPKYAAVRAAMRHDPDYLHKHVVPTDQYLIDVRRGTLPAVAWIVPTDSYSEHPPSSVQTGMMYVTSLINAIMATGQPGWTGTNYWQNTVIILAWDDWGGFYDHVPPVLLDTLPDGTQLGYGFRVPSIVISPYVKGGTIDHQTMSFDAYNRFIEDIFLGGQRLDPATDGRPDSRPDVRENATVVHDLQGNAIPIGDLMNDFDFSQSPLPPLIQPTTIPLDVKGSRTGANLVSINWTLVTTDIVTGYNVKRSTTPGSGYTALPGCSGVGFLVNLCIDTDAPAVQPYYYVVSSIAPDGSESPNSAAAEIPK